MCHSTRPRALNNNQAELIPSTLNDTLLFRSEAGGNNDAITRRARSFSLGVTLSLGRTARSRRVAGRSGATLPPEPPRPLRIVTHDTGTLITVLFAKTVKINVGPVAPLSKLESNPALKSAGCVISDGTAAERALEARSRFLTHCANEFPARGIDLFCAVNLIERLGFAELRARVPVRTGHMNPARFEIVL